MNTPEKKKGRSFSLTDAELRLIEDRTAQQGFSDRNEYLLALLEADRALDLHPEIDEAAGECSDPMPTASTC